MSLIVTEKPSVPLVTTQAAKDHLRIRNDEFDDYITTLVSAVQSIIDGPDGILGRAVLGQTLKYTADHFPRRHNDVYRRLFLPLPPAIGVTTLQYVAPSGDVVTMSSDDYRSFDMAASSEAYLLPAVNAEWPETGRGPGSVVVTYQAGYVTVPPAIVHAAKLLISHFYENRDAVVGVLDRSITPTQLPFGVRALLAPFEHRSAH